MKHILVILPFLLLAGCQSTQSPVVDIAPLSTQIGNLSDANADLKVANERLQSANAALQAENEHLKSMLRADADAGLAANGKGWLPFERYVWNHQIALLPVSPDTVTAEKWSEASTLYATGKEAAMQHVINGLNADAKTTNAKLGELSQNIEQLTKERDSAQEFAMLAKKAVDTAQADLSIAIEKGRHEAEQAIKAKQVSLATAGGVSCMGLAILVSAAAFFAPAARLRLIGLAAFFIAWSLSLFGLARWLGNPWFERGVIIAWGAGIVAFISWLIRRGSAQAEEKKKASDAGMVANTIIAALDTFYDTKATSETREDMDAKLWPALESEGPAYDAAVKRIKAAQCDEKALAK